MLHREPLAYLEAQFVFLMLVGEEKKEKSRTGRKEGTMGEKVGEPHSHL